jgi:chromosome segregation ATPase
MTSDRRRKLDAELRRTRAKLDSARAERDLMKAVAEGLHAKVLKLEADLALRAGRGPRDERGGGELAAEPEMTGDFEPEPAEELEELEELGELEEFEQLEELAEAQARADRLAARVSELRLQLSLFVPESPEQMERASQAVANVRSAGEKIQALEMQLANARSREEALTGQIVRLESVVADLESHLEELSTIAERVAEADVATAQAQDRIGEVQSELAAAVAEGLRLHAELDQARERAEAERVLAAADRLRADEASRMLTDLRSRAGDVEGALARISELEVELAQAVEQAERSAAEQAEAAAEARAQQARLEATSEAVLQGADLADAAPELAALIDERDALRSALDVASSRLEALEEVAAHAIFLETELQGARSRLPEIRAAADAASTRIVELRAALEETEAERDAARDALDARLADEQRLRDRVQELEGVLGTRPSSGDTPQTPRAQSPLEADIQARIHRFLEGSEEGETPAGASEGAEAEDVDAAARVWLADGIGEVVDVSEEAGAGADEGSDVTIDLQQHEVDQGSSEVDDAGADAGTEQDKAKNGLS